MMTVTMNDPAVSTARVVTVDHSGAKIFCATMIAVEAIMLQTKARALKRHQCQRHVAGTRIIVTTTKIMVSQAETMSLNERLKMNPRTIAPAEASWPRRTSFLGGRFLAKYLPRKSLVTTELVTLIMALNVDISAARRTAIKIPCKPTGRRRRTRGMIFSASNPALEPR